MPLHRPPGCGDMEILSLRSRGLKLKEIAQTLGCSVALVGRICQKAAQSYSPNVAEHTLTQNSVSAARSAVKQLKRQKDIEDGKIQITRKPVRGNDKRSDAQIWQDLRNAAAQLAKELANILIGVAGGRFTHDNLTAVRFNLQLANDVVET